jgi:putative transposase
MSGSKDLPSAAKIIADIETTHMIRKGQCVDSQGQVMAAAGLFYSLAS